MGFSPQRKIHFFSRAPRAFASSLPLCARFVRLCADEGIGVYTEVVVANEIGLRKKPERRDRAEFQLVEAESSGADCEDHQKAADDGEAFHEKQLFDSTRFMFFDFPKAMGPKNRPNCIDQQQDGS